MLKIYRVWSDSHHKIQYTFGYFTNKDVAEKVLDAYIPNISGSGPACGIEEISVCEDNSFSLLKDKTDIELNKKKYQGANQ